MYTKDGEKYFIVDAHIALWDARPENQRNIHGKQFIDCFYDYHRNLSPASELWTYEEYLYQGGERLMRDIFENGYVDHAIFQPARLNEFYVNSFGQTEEAFALTQAHPDQLTYNHWFDPRDGEAGLDQLRADAERFGLKGVKLYTADWHGESRGWRLNDAWAYRYFEVCREVGITNIHVHKGPTIWPLDKDAFDVSDIDHVATDYNGQLNFIVEHVGLPRIEDFCFMATQEPNVYAGLSVVIGGLMHARPQFFAKVMGELLFWVGEDKMTFGSDYAIWEPKWQIEGFLNWEMPDEPQFADYPRLDTNGKRKILGLNAAKLYGVEVPAEFQVPGAADPAAAVGVEG